MPARKSANKTTIDPRVERTRRGIVWGFTGAFALSLVAGLLYALGVFDRAPALGSDYRVIAGSHVPAPTAPIQVVEFFSYGCVHCNDFDPQVESWRQRLPAGVQFERSPVTFGSLQYTLFARAYFGLLALGQLEKQHARLFAAVHRNGRTFNDTDQLAQFLAGSGADQTTMRRTLDSPRVTERVAAAANLEQRFGVQEIPTLVIAERYRIDVGTVGRAQALRLATQLINDIRAGKSPVAK